MAMMTKKAKKTKAQPVAPNPPAIDTTLDLTALAQLTAANPAVPGWQDRRHLASCIVCGDLHMNPLSYAARIVKRGNPTDAEIEWLKAHLAGIAVPTPTEA